MTLLIIGIGGVVLSAILAIQSLLARSPEWPAGMGGGSEVLDRRSPVPSWIWMINLLSLGAIYLGILLRIG